MLKKILKDRVESLTALNHDIDVALQDLEFVAVDKDKAEEKTLFIGVSKDLKSCINEYLPALKNFLQNTTELIYADYEKQFKKRDHQLNGLVQGYVHFQSKLASTTIQ
mgnify:CR=1 FL=1